MASIGQQLREAREARGLSLEDIAAETRIRLEYLEAIESDNFAALPDEVVARGFVRNFARTVGLDPETLMAELGAPRIEVVTADQFRLESEIDEPLAPSPVPWGRLVSALALVVGVLAVLGALVWLYPQRSTWLEQLGLAGLLTTENAATPTPTPTVLIAGAGAQEGETVATTPTPTPTPTATPVPTATRPPRTPTPTPGEAAPPTAVDGVQVQVIAEQDVWLLVEVDGEKAFEGLMQPGDTREWVGRERVFLRTGNAGGTHVFVNGVDIGVLGDSGEVLSREIYLDPQSGMPVLGEPQPTPVPTTTG